MRLLTWAGCAVILCSFVSPAATGVTRTPIFWSLS